MRRFNSWIHLAPFLDKYLYLIGMHFNYKNIEIFWNNLSLSSNLPEKESRMTNRSFPLWTCTNIMICKICNWTKMWIVICSQLQKHPHHNFLIYNFIFYLPLILSATHLLRLSSHEIKTSWSVTSSSFHYPPAHMLTTNKCFKFRHTLSIHVFYHLNYWLWCGYDALWLLQDKTFDCNRTIVNQIC